MSVREQLLSIIVNNPGFKLNPSEICFFQARAQIGTPSRQTTTTTSTKPGIGIGVKLTKHFGIGIGRQKVTTKTESQTVWDKDPCDFYVMDDCIILKKGNQNITINYESITNLKVNKDALTIICGLQNWYLFMAHKDVERFINVYKLLGDAGREGFDPKTLYSETPNATPPPAKQVISSEYAQTVFLWCVGRKATPVMKRDEYPKYLFYDCNIQNSPKYHLEMIKSGYLVPSPMAENLASLKLSELKEILQNNGLSTSGKKADLIKSIIESVPAQALTSLFPEEKYVLSDLGKAFLDAHDDYIKLKEHQNWQISIAEYDAAKGNNKSFYDVCWGILNRRLTGIDNLTDHRNIYYSMFTLLKEEGDKKNALAMLLRVLYYDVNSLSSGYLNSYLQGYIKKKEFLDKAAQEVCFAPAIIKEIGDLEEYFSEEMINRLYAQKAVIQPCSKNLFSEMIHAIFEGSFDEALFKQRIINDYRKA